MRNEMPINVDAASAAEWDAIPALAGHGYEIVRYREDRGGFSDVKQLDKLPGLTGKADGATASLTVGDR
jgi:competence protein ComEA